MSEWIECPLETLADISSGGTPSRANPSFWNGHIPWVTPTDITACQTNYLFDTRDTVTETGVSSSSAKLLPEGTLLLTSRATIGELKIAARPLTTNQGFKNLVPRPAVDGGFLFYQLSRSKAKFERYAAGSTFLEINRRDVGRVTIMLPRSTEVQQKIARILQTIDQAIEKTQALIDKYKQIRAGLMHDLFTRGIGPDGKLRPPREQAPELYQETPMGWIPKEWDLLSIGDLCSQIADCPHSTPKYRDSGIPCIRTADMLPGKLMLDKAYYVDEHDYINRIQRLKPREGDIIYSREGERLGIASPVGSEPVCLGQRVMILRPSEHVDPDFLLWMMNHIDFYRRVTKGLGATTSPHINVGDIQRTHVFVPNLSEQVAIGGKLKSVQARLDNEEAFKATVDRKKSGLVHDLLTGEVLVHVESKEERAVETA